MPNESMYGSFMSTPSTKGVDNKLVRELDFKLEKKAFEIAKQYDLIKDYKASLASSVLILHRTRQPLVVQRYLLIHSKNFRTINLTLTGCLT